MKDYLLLLFLFIPLLVWSQKKKTTKDPDISFRISTSGTTEKGVRYDVYLKSSEDLDSALVMGLLLTVVTDKNSKSRVLTVENDYTNKLSYFSFLADFAKKEFNFHSFYIDYRDYFPFSLSTSKKEEIKILTFYTDGPCGESIRLLRGVSQFSKHSQPTQVLDGSGGPTVDDAPRDQNMQNSIILVINSSVVEAYKGSNYGFAKGCTNNSSARVGNTTPPEAPSKYRLNISTTDLEANITVESNEQRCIAVPNPVPYNNQIEIQTSNFEPINFKLYSQFMQQRPVDATKSQATVYQVNLNSGLPAGIYYLQMLNAQGKTCVVKIVKP